MRSPSRPRTPRGTGSRTASGSSLPTGFRRSPRGPASTSPSRIRRTSPLADEPHLAKTVSEYEPGLALWGGADGLDPLRLLLAALPAHLEPGAPFVFEFGYSQAREVSALVEASPGFRLARIRLDAAGIPRTATAIRK